MSGDAYNPCRVTAIVISIFSCLILQAVTVNAIRYISIPHSDFRSNILPLEESLIADKNILVSPGSVYGLCVANPHKEIDDYCIFYMETNSNVDSSEHLRRCKFTFNNCDEGKCRSFLRREIVAIASNKAVLISHELFKFMGQGRIEILDFLDCKVTPISMPIDMISEEEKEEYSIIGAPTLDTFDVYFKFAYDYDHERRYQGVFDFNGNTITMKNLTNTPRDLEDSGIIMHSPLKGRYIVHSYRDDVTIYRVAYDGSMETVKSYPLNIHSYDDDQSAVSVTNDLLTVCARYYNNITCGQYDNNGKFKFESRVQAPDSLVIHTLEAFNLPGGGFLLLTMKCNDIRKHSRLSCVNPAKHFVVKKFDASGQVIGSLTIDQFPIPAKSNNDDNPKFHFFENEKGEMCLSLLSWNRFRVEGRLTLNIACFKDQDFYP